MFAAATVLVLFVLGLCGPRRVFFLGASVDDAAAAATDAAAASAIEALALLDRKGRNKEEEKRPNAPFSKVPVAARILEKAVVAALGLAAGGDLLGPAGS